MQEDYAKLLTQLGTREAITRRFFLIFEYPLSGTKSVNERDMFLYLQSAVQTAKKYLAMCGNVVLEHKNETRFCVEVLYQLLNRDTSLKESLDERIKKVQESLYPGKWKRKRGQNSSDGTGCTGYHKF